jgi:hypothetical protein
LSGVFVRRAGWTPVLFSDIEKDLIEC